MRTVEDLFEMGGIWAGIADKKTKICINDCFPEPTRDWLGVDDIFTIRTTPHRTINLGLLSFVETYLK